MVDLIEKELITDTLDDLTVGVGIFYVPDFDDLESITYVFMNRVILYEMRKTREEVFGNKIIEVAPEAFEHEGGRLVMQTYANIARDGGSLDLGIVEYSNELVAGLYECSVHQIKKHYVYVQLRNVTELEQTKMELERKNEDLKQFNYIVSHDLQEPLNSIISFTNILNSEKNKLSEIGQRSIDVLATSANRMKAFIRGILEFSKIGVKEKEWVSIKDLIVNLKIDLSNLIQERNAIVDYQGPAIEVNAYSLDLTKLFQNLIVNGIKYTHQDTQPIITIRVKELEKSFEFSVQDNGIGIAEEHFEEIFKVFQRLHRRDQYSGTGIGLSHCKKVVELHGGEIWLTSKIGEGTTFYFTIPK